MAENTRVGRGTPATTTSLAVSASRYRGDMSYTAGVWFGPQSPLPAMAQNAKGRLFDYPTGYNINVNPRSYESISFDMLRRFADNYDLLRILIEGRKDQMARFRWKLVPRDKELKKRGATIPGDMQTRMQVIYDFFLRPDQENFWGDWLRMLLEDMFVIDAATLYRRRNFGGGLFALQPIDGATIKRVIDQYGNTPENGVAYQQVLKGYPAVDYTPQELIYKPRNKRVHKVYGFSPVEQIIMTINIGMRRQMWQLQTFTKGNIPEALIGTPDNWTPDQIKQFQDWWDSMLEGNTDERRMAKFVPGQIAKGYVPTKPAELFGEAEDWLVRVMCYCFSVSPQPFIKMMNRATAQTAQETAVSEGLAPVQEWVKSLMDVILIDDFASPDIEFAWEDEESLDPNIRSQILNRDMESGLMTFNESRLEKGESRIDHPNADRPMSFNTTTGTWTPIFLTDEEKAEQDAKEQAQLDAKNPPPVDDGSGGEPGDAQQQPAKPKPGKPEPASPTLKKGEGVGEPADTPFPAGCCAGQGGKGTPAKADKPALYADPLRPSVAKVEKKLKRQLSAMLSKLGASVAKQFAKAYPGPKVAKADSPNDFDVDSFLADLDLDILEISQEGLEEALAKVGVDAAKISLAQMGQRGRGDIVDTVNERAVKYAKERAADLVGVSDNPEFALDDSTRDMLRATIADGIEANLSTGEIGDLLEESYAFSEERAQTIAATEITSANSMASLASYEEAADLGIGIKKSWLVLEDGCDICQGNADDGAIELDQPFSSGDMAPGAHPHCRCVLVPEVEDGDGNITDGEEIASEDG